MSKYVYENCLVLRVVDGDTIEIDVDLGFTVRVRKTVRLYGIDAYETSLRRGTTKEEKRIGREGKAYLKNLIEGECVKAETIKDKGKYGRYIAKIYFEGDNICDLMVKEGYAVKKDY